MKLNIKCESCANKIKIEYDETLCSVQYCPFCGEEIVSEDGEFEFDMTYDNGSQDDE